MTHSPAPWTWNAANRTVLDADGKPVCRLEPTRPIGDAHVIAAAPDLLAACEAVVKHYESMSGNPSCPIPDKYWIHGAILARAAIALAKKGAG